MVTSIQMINMQLIEHQAMNALNTCAAIIKDAVAINVPNTEYYQNIVILQR